MKKIFTLTVLFASMLATVLLVPVYAQEEPEGPSIFLKSNLNKVDAGKVVKITITFSETVSKFNKSQLAIDGGNVESLRKLSSVSYLAFVRADDDAKEVDVQVEASTVQNTKKEYNAYASNNLIVKIIPPPVPKKQEDTTSISKLLNSIFPPVSNTESSNTNTQQTTQTQPVQQQAAQQVQQQQVTYYYCNGYQIPTTVQCTPQFSPYNNSYGYYDVYGNYYPPTSNTNSYYPYGYNNYGQGYYNQGITNYEYVEVEDEYESSNSGSGYFGSFFGW